MPLPRAEPGVGWCIHHVPHLRGLGVHQASCLRPIAKIKIIKQRPESLTVCVHRFLWFELRSSNDVWCLVNLFFGKRFGFSWRGSKNETRDFEDKDVRQMLEVYGGVRMVGRATDRDY